MKNSAISAISVIPVLGDTAKGVKYADKVVDTTKAVKKGADALEEVVEKTVKEGAEAGSKKVSKEVAEEGTEKVTKEAGEKVGKGGSETIPDKAKDIANQVKTKNGAAPQGYKGGKVYKNMPKEGAEKLPEGINYKEYDVNPYIKGQDRGMERIIIGDDGSVWYTDNHYDTFTKIE